MTKKYSSLDLKFLLLENYKRLNINENELVVILMLNHLLESGNEFITNELLSIKMTYDLEKIDEIMCSLIKKNLLEYVTTSKGGLKASLNPLYKILYNEFAISVLGNGIVENSTKQDEITKLYKKFNIIFGRSLAPIELQRIDERINSYKYSLDEIEYALKEAKINDSLSIKYIDKILLNSKKRDDIKKEGYTFRNANLNDDVDNVIEVLKTKRTNSNEK